MADSATGMGLAPEVLEISMSLSFMTSKGMVSTLAPLFWMNRSFGAALTTSSASLTQMIVSTSPARVASSSSV